MNIDFYWDVGSTNSYFALQLIKPIAVRYGATLSWHPFNLGYVFQANNYVLMDEPRAKMANRLADLLRWAKKYNLPFQIPDNFPIKTSRALKGAIAMRRWNKEEEYIEAIFSAYWENNVGTIGEYDTLCDIVATLGIDADEFKAACESPQVRQSLINSTNTALETGIFGAPTMVIEGEIYWGKDRMEFIEDHLAQLSGKK